MTALQPMLVRSPTKAPNFFTPVAIRLPPWRKPVGSAIGQVGSGTTTYRAIPTRGLGRCRLNKTARIVLLNGVGSAGKGSIAKALQSITAERFLHVEMDAFLQMLPESSFGHPDGLTFETIYEDG
jgi:hypothetical protein